MTKYAGFGEAVNITLDCPSFEPRLIGRHGSRSAGTGPLQTKASAERFN